MINILYSFQESKKGMPDGGEDRLVITDDFVAVIDGATSKSGEKFEGKTGGVLAAEAISDAIKRLPRAVDAFNAVALLTKAVKNDVIDRYMPHLNDPAHTGDRPNAAVVIYSDQRREIWRVGDGHYAVGGQIKRGGKEIDTLNAKLRSAYIRAMLKSGTASIESLMERDLGREIIMPSLMNQPLLMNQKTSMGYGTIDGRPVPDLFIEAEVLPAREKTVLLTSDGVLEPLNSHANSTSIKTKLEKQLDYYKADPLMIGPHKSTKGLTKGNKWHDDITIVKFSI